MGFADDWKPVDTALTRQLEKIDASVYRRMVWEISKFLATLEMSIIEDADLEVRKAATGSTPSSTTVAIANIANTVFVDSESDTFNVQAKNIVDNIVRTDMAVLLQDDKVSATVNAVIDTVRGRLNKLSQVPDEQIVLKAKQKVAITEVAKYLHKTIQEQVCMPKPRDDRRVEF